MKLLENLTYLFLSLTAFGQWDVIHASANNGGHRDLFFLNNDTGFIKSSE